MARICSSFVLSFQLRCDEEEHLCIVLETGERRMESIQVHDIIFTMD